MLETFEVFYEESNEECEVTLYYSDEAPIIGTMNILAFLCEKYAPEMLGETEE